MSAPGLARSHLEAILASCPDPIVGETVDGVINYWNAAAEQFYGYSADEVIGKPLSILAPEGHEAELENLLQRVQQGTMVEAYETVRRSRDGRLLDVSLTLFPVQNEAGQIVGAAATTRDITQRKRDAAALAASERRFRAAFDDAPNGMALIGLNGEILQINRAGGELLGYSERELRQMTVADVMHAQDRETTQFAWNQTISCGGWGHTREVRMVHRDGSLRWISMQASLVRDEQGGPAYFIVQAEDLTERVRARESLSSARTLMQETLEQVGGAFIAVDSDWRMTQVNATAEELLGMPHGSLLGRKLQEIVDPDLLVPLVDAITATLTDRRQTYIAEFPYPPRQAWFTLRAYATADGVSLSIRDVTQVRHLAQELRLAELRFQALVEQLPAAVYMVANDDDETMIYLSPYFEELTGYSIERDNPCRTSRDWQDLIHPDDRKRVLREDDAFNHDKNHLVQEYRLRRADGSYIWVSDVYASMLDDAGQIMAWQGVMVDITAEVEAREAISRLASIVEASDDAIYSRTLAEGIITYWNPAAERLYGYTATEAVGQPMTMLFGDGNKPLITDPNTFRLSPSRHFETCHVRKDGEVINVAVTLFPIRDAEGNVTDISGIVRDISDRIVAEQELRMALDAAETGVRAKGLFLAMMSHELRTPLQAVLGYADFLLSGRQGKLSRAQNEDIGYIHLGANRMV
jgi:PAS domain S-box-containing protein